MRRLAFLILILMVPCKLPAGAPEISAQFDTESELEQGTDIAPATAGEFALAKDASEILVRMTDFISAAPAFTLVSDTGYEVLQKNGHMLEFGSQLTLAIQRPSNAIGRFDARDGSSATIVFDGSDILIYNTKENVYYTTRQPGDIDTSLDLLAKQFAVPLQLVDFFSKDLKASLSKAVKSGHYIGASMISGVMCDHLALRGEKQDVQVWIARNEEPIPRRIMITYKQIEGQPRFWAQFNEWDFSPELSDATFKFLPPDSAKRVNSIVDSPGEDLK